MSPAETVDIKALKAELLQAIRDEVGHELAALRAEVQPAMRLSASLARIGEAVADAARFIKWGVGVGAGIATIAGALRVLDIL